MQSQCERMSTHESTDAPLTCEDWGLFQLTGTSTGLEEEPEEVEEVLRVTARARLFPSHPGETRGSSHRRPMTGVYRPGGARRKGGERMEQMRRSKRGERLSRHGEDAWWLLIGSRRPQWRP